MAGRVGQDVTLEQIDAWFQIGKELPKAKTVSRSKCQGRLLDPHTGNLAEPTSIQADTPHFRRYKLEKFICHVCLKQYLFASRKLGNDNLA